MHKLKVGDLVQFDETWIEELIGTLTIVLNVTRTGVIIRDPRNNEMFETHSAFLIPVIHDSCNGP